MVLGLLAFEQSPAQRLPCEGVDATRGLAIGVELVSDRMAGPVQVVATVSDPDHIWVAEQGGTIRRVRLGDGAVETEPVLDIRDRVLSASGGGLRSVAFAPGPSTTRELFVSYDAREPRGRLVVARYRLSSEDPPRAAAEEEQVVLTIDLPESAARGGSIAVGPTDGHLYLGVGDGGTPEAAQDPGRLRGKILRVAVDGALPYEVPADNPFVGLPDARGEVWALGLRDPVGLGFEPATGDLWLGDRGPTRQEIDRAAAGGSAANFEWPRRDGLVERDSSVEPGPGVATPPAIATIGGPDQPSEPAATLGAVFYDGCRMPDFRGRLLTAESVRARVWSFAVEGGDLVDRRVPGSGFESGIAPDRLDDLVGLGTDAQGEVYLCDFPSKVFRIVPRSLPFVRCDVTEIGNAAGLKEAIVILQFLFFSGFPPACLDAADCDDDGALSITDAIFHLSWLFLGGPPHPPPSAGECGLDPTADELPCDRHLACD